MQYGIRLEHEDISYSEYRRLLTGIMHDTPLGYIVSIRQETDAKRIREMNKQDLRIRDEWRKFRLAHPLYKDTDKQAGEIEFQKIIASLFGERVTNGRNKRR